MDQRATEEKLDDPGMEDSYIAFLDQALQSFESFEASGVSKDLENAIHAAAKCIHCAITEGVPTDGLLQRVDPIIRCEYSPKEMEPLLNLMVQETRSHVSSQCVMSAETCSRLALYLGRLYIVVMGSKLLEEAIDLLRRALKTVGDNRGTRAKVMIDLGVYINNRFEATGSWKDLDEAIAVAREAMRLLTTDDRPRAFLLSFLTTRLELRYEHSGKSEDLEEAIESGRQALSLTPKDDQNYIETSLRLASALENANQDHDLENVVRNARTVVDSTTGIGWGHQKRWTLLGEHYHLLYRKKRELSDLQEAVSWSRKALNCTTDLDRSEILVHLVQQLFAIFEHQGDVSSLEEAISHSRLLVDAESRMVARLSSLGGMLFRLYERTLDPIVLEESIQACERALSVLENPNSRANCLSNLGCALIYRYGRDGDLNDLNMAINVTTKASQESGSSKSRESVLSNLGSWLTRRYERTHVLALLEESIRCQRQVLEIRMSRGDSQSLAAETMANLATSLYLRYKRSKRKQDLYQAQYLLAQAVELANPANPARRADMVGNLAMVVANWYEAEERKPPILLEEAIALSHIALKHVPRDNVAYTGFLMNAANMYHQKFSATNNMEDLNEAITYARKALDMTTPSNPEHSLSSLCLSLKLASRYHRTRDLQDLQDAIHSLHEAVEMPVAQPMNRIRAAIQCLDLCVKAGDTHLDTGIQVGERALDLLPVIDLRILDRNDQQHVVSAFAGLASDLLALYVAAGRVSDGLENLERARTIIIGQILDSASDFSDLETLRPELVDEFRASQARIDATFTNTSGVASQWDLLKQREDAMNMFNSSLAKIRSLDGHERFLMGLTTAEMQQISTDGWIVVVNVTRDRSDAILVSRHAIKAVPLPDLDFVTAKAYPIYKRKKQKGDTNALNEVNEVLTSILKCLWDNCVKIVIQAILSETSRQLRPLSHKRPRVWWIGVGAASWMPFHAAGHHEHATTNHAMAHIISSYTPSFKALQHSQKRTPHHLVTRPTEDPMLLITMPETPSRTGRHTSSNADLWEDGPNVESAAGPYVTIRTLTKPSVHQVMEVLGDYPIVHFGCHGESDRDDPSNSHMILRRVDSNSGLEQQDYLTLRHITRLQLSRAHLAYLSACSTAESSVEDLSDEVLHLVSGFQVAGFPHVIGCLWEADDTACLDVSRQFYTSFLKDGLNAASALQSAVETLLLDPKTRRDPLKWAPFVYFGS